MIPPVYALLTANMGVTSLISTRIYPFGEAPQGVTYPYVTFKVITGDPQNTQDKPPQVDNLGTQIDIWAATGDTCLTVARAVRDALEPTAHMTSISDMDRDLETKSFRYRLDFDFFTFR